MSGIYIHIPFCRQKCIYCNFFSVANLQQKEHYLKALRQEIGLTTSFLPHNEIETIYIGGGTPSLCTIAELARLIETIQQHYQLQPNYEFTIEVNPEKLTSDYLRSLRALGINRISIGIQSFDDRILKFLRRQHTGTEAINAVEMAAAAGFDNISIDLIYDIVFRDESLWRSDLQTALGLPIEHLSAYALTIEENTLLQRQLREGKVPPLAEELTERDFYILHEMTAQAGFAWYEISNFAKNGRISKHNFSYWTEAPYLGLGAAAHSYDGKSRRWNTQHIATYIDAMAQGKPLYESEDLTTEAQYEEQLYLTLRTKRGIDTYAIRERFGEARYQELLQNLKRVNKEYYTFEKGIIRLTLKGMLFVDAMVVELM